MVCSFVILSLHISFGQVVYFLFTLRHLSFTLHCALMQKGFLLTRNFCGRQRFVDQISFRGSRNVWWTWKHLAWTLQRASKENTLYTFGVHYIRNLRLRFCCTGAAPRMH